VDGHPGCRGPHHVHKNPVDAHRVPTRGSRTGGAHALVLAEHLPSRLHPRWWLQVGLVLAGPDESVMKSGVGGDATDAGDRSTAPLQDAPSHGEIPDVQQVEHPDAACGHLRHDAVIGPVAERVAPEPSALQFQHRR